MRSLFDNGMVARSGGPFLGFNLTRFVQDISPVYQATRNLVKDQSAANPAGTLPLVPPVQPRPIQQPDNTMLYVMGLLALGGAGAAYYFLRKKKPAKK